jgi:hypothetical protein
LENVLGIQNNFVKKAELSSKFIYNLIELLGGPHVFFANFYFTSVSPIGFTKNNKNLNYYDQKDLEDGLKPYIIENLHKQIDAFPTNKKIAFCLGMGKNFKYLEKLNKEQKFFEQIIPLPHPRWVMQYRLKNKEHFLLEYEQNLVKEMKFT